MKGMLVRLLVAALAYAAAHDAVGRLHAQPAELALADRQQDRWSWHGRIPVGKTIEVKGINGSIAAQAASGDEVTVTADKHGRRSDPDEVRIEVLEHRDGVTVCAVYPGRHNYCGAGDDGRMSTPNNDVEVDFVVHVPRGVAFVGSNVNGDVEATELAGPVEARTVNGGVSIATTTGEATASTVNGAVTAVVRGAGDRQPLRFRTVNGSITLSLPANLGADVDAQTVNGTISTDFPVTVTGRLSPRRLVGRIGDGGRDLRLSTVNGSIRVRSLR